MLENALKILVGTDFSPASDAALDEAAAVARRTGAAVELVHVREPFRLPVTNGIASTEVGSPISVDWIDENLDRRRDRLLEDGVVCNTTSLEGTAASTLAEHADRTGADLLVVGRHGRGRVASALLGSVARRLVERAHCPVLVIPPRG